jgi:serine/threonine protein kinase
MAAPTENDPPLLHIGSYTLLYKLGSGSFANVFLGLHDLIHCSVAIKQIPKCRIGSNRSLTLIHREQTILKALVHQYIIELFEVLEDEHNLYLVMELAEHGSLAARISPDNPLPEAECARLFRQIVIALGYLHHFFNIYHRDLKAENILLDREDNVKLVDFGLANVFQPGMAQTYCGSPSYAAPEVLRKAPYSKSADLWSLGVLLYLMATGTLPFVDSSLPRLLHRILEEEVVFPMRMPGMLKDLIGRLLQKRPENRIEIVDILDHPWLCESVPASSMAEKLAKFHSRVKDDYVDQMIVKELREQNVATTGLAEALLRGEYNEQTAPYRIKRRQKLTDKGPKPMPLAGGGGAIRRSAHGLVKWSGPRCKAARRATSPRLGPQPWSGGESPP